MHQNSVYGTGVEIRSFVEIFDVHVTVFSRNFNYTTYFGNNLSNFKMELLLFNEHYDIIDYVNDNINIEIKRIKNINYKRKNIFPNCVPNKKLKLDIVNKNHVSDSNNLEINKDKYENRKRKIDLQNCTTNKKIKLEINQEKIKCSKLKEDSYYGEMTYRCSFCFAVYWKEERKKSNCCHSGKVILSPLSKFDSLLKNMLLYDKYFRHLIRYYNNLYSFATFSANVINEKQKAIYNLKIQGQVCHIVPNTILPVNNEEPYCGQLYIYDTNTAIEKRLNANKNITKKHLQLL